MQEMAFNWTTRVRYIDTDTSGRIHYTAMFRYFEAAETEFLRALGHGYPGLSSDGQGWPRVHAECDISGALVFDDELTVQVSVTRIGTSSMELAFRALITDAECAKGRLVIVCMDRATGRSKPLPTAFADALRLQIEHAV